MNPIYLDNAATTQIRDEVISKMSEVLKSNYGNASSTHALVVRLNLLLRVVGNE